MEQSCCRDSDPSLASWPTGLVHPIFNKSKMIIPARMTILAIINIATALLSVVSGNIYSGPRQYRLIPMLVAQIPSHTESTHRSLQGVDYPVTVSVEFRKMVVQKLACQRVQNSACPAVPIGVVPLRLLE